MRAAEQRHEGRETTVSRVPDAHPASWPDARSSGHPAELLLAALGKTRFTSQTFADNERATRRPTIRHGPWLAQRRHLEDDNRHNMGAYFMVNDGDLQGRRSENVTDVVAYFADFDGVELPDSWPRPPTAVVESSPHKFHVYWRVLSAPLATFAHVQKHLAVLFGSDPKVVDLPRVLRLPGLVHAKAEPFVSRLVMVEPRNVIDHAEFVDVFAIPHVETIERQPLRAPAGTGRLRRYVWSAVQGEHDRVAATTEGSRNTTLLEAAVKLGSLVGAGMLAEVDAHDALLAGAQATADPLPVHEADNVIRRGLAYGIRHPRQLDAGDA